MDWLIEPVEQERPSPVGLTVEHAAYAAVGLLALALRFFGLGLRPLNAAESLQALAAYRFTQGAIDVAPAGTVPALFTGNVVGFTLLGANDALARLLPALAGLLLVLLPYGLRHRLGRGGALVASLLLAISPSLLFFSRSLDGAIVASACGLAVVVGLIRYVDGKGVVALYLAAVALGVGLAAGPQIFFLLLIFALFGLALYAGQQWLGRETGWPVLAEAFREARRGSGEEGGGRGLLVQAGAVLAAVFGLVATALVLHPAGIGLAADLLGGWLQGLLPGPGGNPAIYPLLLLLRYEPLILVLGLIQIGAWLVRDRGRQWERGPFASPLSHTAFLAFWAGVAFLLVVLGGQRPAGHVLLVVVPLALLAGQGVERTWRWIDGRTAGPGSWGEVGLAAAAALGLGVFFYLQIVAYSNANSAATISVVGMTIYATSSYLLLGLVAVLLLAGLAAGVWVWRGPGLVLAGGWLALVLALALFGFKSAWGLNFAHAADPRELMIGQTTDPDVRLLVDQLEELSLNQSGDVHTLPLTVDAATGPVVAWYLREFENRVVVEGISAPVDTLAAVSLAGANPPIGETFRGQGFALRSHWLPWGLWGQDFVRWLLLGKASLPVVDQEVVLWVADVQAGR
jgi:uncharacterized protein (TIGR03663 family)